MRSPGRGPAAGARGACAPSEHLEHTEGGEHEDGDDQHGHRSWMVEHDEEQQADGRHADAQRGERQGDHTKPMGAEGSGAAA